MLCAGVCGGGPRQRSEAVPARRPFACGKTWCYRRMHITGGVGAFANEEKFGPDYTLPNDAYLETCAAVGAGFFHRNMNLAFGRAATQMSWSGPSTTAHSRAFRCAEIPTSTRTPWNAALRARAGRGTMPLLSAHVSQDMGSMPGYIYATEADSIYMNLFVGSHASIEMKGSAVLIKQSTRYPWKARSRSSWNQAPRLFRPHGSHPGMVQRREHHRQRAANCLGPASPRLSAHRRQWRPGDVVELEMPMPVQQIRANPLVQADWAA